MGNVRLTRRARIPDPLRVNRYRKAPELGPHLLFFSGGSAINGLSKVLKQYTHNSIHLVTTFDSGGSSAKLRSAFHMPAIGDLRSRLMALADESISGHPEVIELFSHRLSETQSPDVLRAQLLSLVEGSSKLVRTIANPMRNIIREQLACFAAAMPEAFDLRGASIGNLILAGGYLQNGHQLDQILFLFSKLVHVQGTVRAIVESPLHLCVNLANGEQICAQHRITGKETAPITGRIQQLLLSADADQYAPAQVRLSESNRQLIEHAELICYPPGSFYSSVLANFLPDGVAEAIQSNPAPKVYVPNLGTDPEQFGLSLLECVHALRSQLINPGQANPNSVLDFVLVDQKNGKYEGQWDGAALAALGIQLIDTDLISADSAPYYDNQKLVEALLSLV